MKTLSIYFTGTSLALCFGLLVGVAVTKAILPTNTDPWSRVAWAVKGDPTVHVGRPPEPQCPEWNKDYGMPEDAMFQIDMELYHEFYAHRQRLYDNWRRDRN